MAVVVNKPDLNDPNSNIAAQQAPISGNAGSTITPGAANNSGASVAPTVNSAQPSGSGRFTNLQKYMQANQGSGEKITGKIGDTVNQTGAAADSSIQNANNTVQNQLQSEKDRLAQASGFAQQVQQDPTQLVNNPNQLAAFNQIRTGTNAANDIQANGSAAFGNAQSQLNNLQSQANMAGTESGRFQLLRDSLGRPTYNTGQQRLDQLLVQGAGGNTLANLQTQAQQTAAQESKAYNDAQTAYNNGLTNLGTATTAGQSTINNALGRIDDPNTLNANESTGAFGSLQQQLQQQQQAYIAQQTALQNQINSGLSGPNKGAFTADAMKALGLTEGQHLYGADLSSLVQPSFSPGNVTEQSTATQDQYNKYKALTQLAGTDPGYLNPSQVGTATGVNVNNANLLEAINSGQQQFATNQNNYQTLEGQINPINFGWLNGYSQDPTNSHPGYSSAGVLQQFNNLTPEQTAALLGKQDVNTQLQSLANSSGTLTGSAGGSRYNPGGEIYNDITLNGAMGNNPDLATTKFKNIANQLLGWYQNYNSLNPNLVARTVPSDLEQTPNVT